jgi:DNA-binding response OmpR family regulator
MDSDKKKKILLVEDDASLSEMYQSKLSIEGFDVVIARNGGEGLQVALSTKPDLILLDIMLPGLDGMTVMKRLRDDPWGKSVPIIILTNLNADDKILKGVMEGHPAYYLMKSTSDPASVSEKVKEVLK